MAKLSERVDTSALNTRKEYGAETQRADYTSGSRLDDIKTTLGGINNELSGKLTELFNLKGDNMNALRTINLTLVDNNPNLKGEDKIVFQKLNYVTEHNDDQSIQQILMSGDVAKSLEQHNILRVEVIDKEIRRNTGRDVMLEEVEIFDLNWMLVRVA